MSTISSFKSIENKHNVYKCKGCMKKFCEYLREHATLRNIKIKFLIKEQRKSYENEKLVLFVKNIQNKYFKNRKKCKARYHRHFTGEYRGVVHSICELKKYLKKFP